MGTIHYEKTEDETTILYDDESSSLDFLEMSVNLLSASVNNHVHRGLVAPVEAWEMVIDYINREIENTNFKIEKHDGEDFGVVIKYDE